MHRFEYKGTKKTRLQETKFSFGREVCTARGGADYRNKTHTEGKIARRDAELYLRYH
jgi:hypothetical protein